MFKKVVKTNKINYVAPGTWRTLTIEEIRNLERAIADTETEGLP